MNETGPGVYSFTVAQTGLYEITAIGGMGQSSTASGGYGALVQDDFNLTAGTVLSIIVGKTLSETAQKVGPTQFNGAGGGASGVAILDNSIYTPLIVAGGGGGGGSALSTLSANQNGQAALPNGAVSSGESGNNGSTVGGGKSGGANGSSGASGGTVAGGTGLNAGWTALAGSSGYIGQPNNTDGVGGAGYSGGGAGVSKGAGGGGSSYDTGLNGFDFNSVSGFSLANGESGGLVVISFDPTAPVNIGAAVPEPASALLFGSAAIGAAWLRLRQRQSARPA